MTTLADSVAWIGGHSVHVPDGPVALLLDRLGDYMYAVSAVLWVLVTAALLWAVFRRRAEGEDPNDPARERRMQRTVTLAVAASAAILFVFLFLSYDTSRAMTGRPAGEPLQIRVTGHQWWWEVEYRDSLPQHWATTANEIHVPVGRPVVFDFRSSDVNHSFWVPQLGGKRDLIPGQETSLWFRADTAGVYRGQCAEFCGYQHAKMAFEVIAEPPPRFAEWLVQQRDTAATPTDSLAQRGQLVFVTSPCVMCHSISGTTAGSRIGPDLTHIASRRTIAAGTLLNTQGNLFAWITDPQGLKPGTRMPATQLGPKDLAAVVAYLETLR
ncbi:MAG TPA: cytochrome c oxidase subunit II [Gemmatimonadales bacterium]|nr:cytochrome c oxidase subunit II [Gemmatimonadales bacterium]